MQLGDSENLRDGEIDDPTDSPSLRFTHTQGQSEAGCRLGVLPLLV